MTVLVNATFEVDTDHHITWFSSTVVRDSGDAHSGSWSLLSTSTAAFGSGVALDNYPYFSGVVAGTSYDCSVWYKESTATMPTTTWNLKWYDSAVTLLRTDTISLPRVTAWTNAAGTFISPTGAVTLGWDFQFSTSAAGPAFRLDDLLIQTTPAAAALAPPPPGLLVSRLQPYFG